MLSGKNKFKVATQIIGLLFFSFLFFLAWIFFKERMLCLDTASFLFKMIEYKTFIIEFERWGAVPSQIFPLWAIKNVASLETVMKIYSLSFILIFYAVFLILTVGLDNYRGGIALLLALCLVFRHTFYYSTAELYQGMALAFVVWALIVPEKEYNSVKKRWISAVIASILIYAISYCHQVALFVVLFICFIEFFNKKSFKNLTLIATSFFAVVWFFIRVFFLSTSNYEKEKIINAKIFFEQLPNIFKLPSYLYFKQFYSDNFIAFSLTISLFLILVIYRKKIILLFFSTLYIAGYLLLVFITFYRGESPLVLEHYFTVLSFFYAALLMVLLYDKFEPKWILLIVTPLLILNLKNVFNGHFSLTKRIEYMERLITYGRTFEKRKFILHNHNFPWQYSWVKWTFPFETAILSSLKSPDSTLTFFVSDDINKYDNLVNKETSFLGAEWDIARFTSNNLDKNYFRLPLTGYEKLSSYQNDSAFHESYFSKENLKLIPEKEIYYSSTDSFIVASIAIINNSDKKLVSIPDCPSGVYLSYHIFNSNGDLLIWDGVRTILEADVAKKYSQGLYIRLPDEDGEYIVDVDFVTENTRWWEINSRFKIIVD